MTSSAGLPPRDNVGQSLVTAGQVLAHLHESLVRAGFSEGQEAYVKMSELMAGQRLWAQANAPGELDGAFGQLSRMAASIYAILQPYAEAMRRIAALAPPEEPVTDSRVLERIAERRGRPVSVTTLVAETGMERAAIDEVLEALVTHHGVERHTSGGRLMYSLPRRTSQRGTRGAHDRERAAP